MPLICRRISHVNIGNSELRNLRYAVLNSGNPVPVLKGERMEQTLPKYGANQRSGGISGNTLKMIAIITMLIDHIGAGVVEPYLSMNMGAMDGNEMFNRLYYLDRGLQHNRTGGLSNLLFPFSGGLSPHT